jgi:hypothetical protein
VYKAARSDLAAGETNSWGKAQLGGFRRSGVQAMRVSGARQIALLPTGAWDCSQRAPRALQFS